jgi:putative SOS response-associated peptidase YedK
MCGRFAIAYTMGLFARFGVKESAPDFEARYNIAPTQTVPIILKDGARKAVMMRWGLVPFWAKDPKIGNRLINARAETAATRPAFRASLKKRRCLVPATGFYEWRMDGKTKTPFYAHMKDDSLFGLAGVYDRWTKPDGEPLMTFTILTTEPNSLMDKIHNRMPVILDREEEDTWLNPGEIPSKVLTDLFRPCPAKSMSAFQVSKAVNNPRNDAPELIKPV